MKQKIIGTLYVLCAIGVLALIPLFLSKDAPLEVTVSSVTLRELNDIEAKQKKQAVSAVVRRMYRCETDEDCIIVDKDPCGCWVGPSGVTAINIGYTLEFTKMAEKSVAKTCPTTPPSTEKECSPNARPVCKAKTCRIAY